MTSRNVREVGWFVAGFASLAFVALCAVAAWDAATLRRGLPPGYYLEQDGLGHYRACRSNYGPLIFQGGDIKVEAVRWAWSQYDHDNAEAAKRWTRVTN